MYDSASNWSMHCHIHTGDKPYHCTVCNNHTISTLDNVNLITRHLKVVPTLERTYIKYRSCYSFNNNEYFVNEDGITEITVILFCYYQAWARKRLLDLISLLTNVTVCIVCSSINMISGLVYMWPGAGRFPLHGGPGQVKLPVRQVDLNWFSLLISYKQIEEFQNYWSRASSDF